MSLFIYTRAVENIISMVNGFRLRQANSTPALAGSPTVPALRMVRSFGSSAFSPNL
jgi:hypothetical protein